MEHRPPRASSISLPPAGGSIKWECIRSELNESMPYEALVKNVETHSNSIEHGSIFDGYALYGAIVCNGNGCSRDFMQYSLNSDIQISEISHDVKAKTPFILVFDHGNWDDGNIHRFIHMSLSKNVLPVFIFDNETRLTDFSREIHSLAGAFSSPNFRMLKFSIPATTINDQMNHVMEIVSMHLPISLTQKTWNKLLSSLSIHGSSFQLLNEIHHTVASEVPDFMLPILYNQSFTEEHISSILYLWNCKCSCWDCSCYNEDNLFDILKEWENLLRLKEALESSMPDVHIAQLNPLKPTRLTSPHAHDFLKIILNEDIPKDIALKCVHSMMQQSPLKTLLI